MRKLLMLVFLVSVSAQADITGHIKKCWSVYKTKYGCTVTINRVIDGDTLDISFTGGTEIPDVFKNIGLRIEGIDTAELDSNDPCEKAAAEKAKTALQIMLFEAKSIEISEPGRDKFFRILASVFVDGVNVGYTLIQKKLAYPYDGGSKQKINWCQSEKPAAQAP